MVTALYAALGALWIVFLTFKVVGERRENRVAYADGGVKSLQMARSAHSNATETIPMSIILLGLMELGGGHGLLIHFLGIALLVGRFLHARAILADKLKGRVAGMAITLGVILLAAVGNLVYFFI